MFLRISQCLLVSVIIIAITNQTLAAGPASRPSSANWEDSTSQLPDRPLFWTKDAVARTQEADTFTTLEDGQPAGPGDWELQLQSGWETRSNTAQHDPFLLEPAVKYTPHRYGPQGAHFLENMQLRLRAPFELGTGNITGNGDLNFGWQQRWLSEKRVFPTFSTLAEFRLPTRNGSSSTDGTVTAIIAKSLSRGVLYANLWARSANGNDIARVRHFQWGLRGGYKHVLSDRTALLAVYSHSTSQEDGRADRNGLELAAMFKTRHHLSFGPGVFIGLDDHAETPHLGAGFRLIYLFNARDNPTLEQLEALEKERSTPW